MPRFNYDVEPIFARAEKLFRRRFLEAVSQISDDLDLAAANLANAYVDAYLLAAEDAAKFIRSALDLPFRFDPVSNRTVEALRSATIRITAEFSSTQRAATRTALSEAFRLGLSESQTAQFVRQSVGLNPRQVRAVANFRRALESGSSVALERALRDPRFDLVTRNSVRGDRPLTQKQIDRMVDLYAKRTLSHRAQTIAQTEAVGAIHQGSDEAIQQAIRAGIIQPGPVQRWHTSGDSKVRNPSHVAMNGQLRPIGQPFVSGTGSALLYPGDSRAPAHDVVGCRCWKSTLLVAA